MYTKLDTKLYAAVIVIRDMIMKKEIKSNKLKFKTSLVILNQNILKAKHISEYQNTK